MLLIEPANEHRDQCIYCRYILKENAVWIEQFLKDYFSVNPDDLSTKEKFEDEYTYNGGTRWLCFYDDIESFQNNINKLIKVNYSIFDMGSYTAEEIENYKNGLCLDFTLTIIRNLTISLILPSVPF